MTEATVRTPVPISRRDRYGNDSPRALNPTPGVTLTAVDALGSQTTFTRAQVAYLMRLAYDSGRTATFRDDLVELHTTWALNTAPRLTYEQRVAQRIAAMEQAAERRHQRPTTPLAPLDCDWPDVTQPGTAGTAA